LDRTLAAFSTLAIPADVSWELLVVNNNSTDDTDRVIDEHKSHLPIERVFEARSGKSHAANTAVRRATGDLILWTDDDVVPDPQWLTEYVNAMRAWPMAGYFGGTVDPLFEGPVPRWVARNVKLLYEPFALAQHGTATFPVESRHIVGANMAIRTDVARQYAFDTQLGPKGEKALRNLPGEETELIARLRAAGFSGLWVGGARVQHVIAEERLSAAYLWYWYSGLGSYTVAREGLAEVPLLMGAPRWAVREYAGLWLKCVCLAPFRNAAWLRSLRQAALMKGYIHAARRRPTVG
jgi:glycosyltransferase involved in cell wall biosynthesis